VVEDPIVVASEGENISSSGKRSYVAGEKHLCNAEYISMFISGE